MNTDDVRKIRLHGDDLLADRSRLTIMGAITASKDPVPFMTLIEALELTKGNLGAHLRKLEEAGYIVCEKSFVDRKPLTTYRSTEKGANAFSNHLAALESFIKEYR